MPDPEFAAHYARQQRRAAELQVLARHPGFHQALGDIVARVNHDLAPIERVRRFLIAPKPFSIDNAQMTPTLKIRRHAIRAAYEAEVDSLYEDNTKVA